MISKLKLLALAVVGVIAALALWTMATGNSADIVLHERVIFKMKNSLDVTVAGKSDGKVAESLVQLSRTFTWTGANGDTKATARVAIISWGTEINVYDGKGARVGSIEERVFSSMFKTWTAYDIKDAGGNRIALSDKTEWLGTTIKLTAPDGTHIATLERPWINIWGDTWEVDIVTPGRVDDSILVMIAAFKTAADRDRDDNTSKPASSPPTKK